MAAIPAAAFQTNRIQKQAHGKTFLQTEIGSPPPPPNPIITVTPSGFHPSVLGDGAGGGATPQVQKGSIMSTITSGGSLGNLTNLSGSLSNLAGINQGPATGSTENLTGSVPNLARLTPAPRSSSLTDSTDNLNARLLQRSVSTGSNHSSSNDINNEDTPTNDVFSSLPNLSDRTRRGQRFKTLPKSPLLITNDDDGDYPPSPRILQRSLSTNIGEVQVPLHKRLAGFSPSNQLDRPKSLNDLRVRMRTLSESVSSLVESDDELHDEFAEDLPSQFSPVELSPPTLLELQVD